MINKPKLSLVLVTYNRSELLQNTLLSILPSLESAGYEFEILIADDSSDESHSCMLKNIPDTRYFSTNVNSGLGANVNNGLSNVSSDYVMQVQDDWRWMGSHDHIKTFVSFMDKNPDIGLLQMTLIPASLEHSRRKLDGIEFVTFKNDRLPWLRPCETRPYSDQPHLKRKTFIDSLGAYREGVVMGQCENDFKKRVANQDRWRVAAVAADSYWVHDGKDHSYNVNASPNPVVSYAERIPLFGRVFVTVLRRAWSLLDTTLAHCRAK